MKFIARPIRRLKQMPETLAGLTCLFAVLGSVTVVAALLPVDGWIYTYQGRRYSYQEFWRSGGGVLVLITGVAMILLAIASYRAQRWVRYAVPLGIAALTICGLVWPAEGSISIEWVGGLAWIYISYWYFNRKQSVLQYFCGSRSAEPDQSRQRRAGVSIRESQ